jgi:mycothiol synthase
VLALAGAAASADGVGPLSEQVRLHLRYGGDPAARNLLLRHGQDLAGYAHLGLADPAEGRSGELVIHPAHRRRGLGLALAQAVLAEESALPVRLWAHGDLPAAARLATVTGFRRTRVLWQMRRSLRDAMAGPRLPPGVSLRTFVPGQDEGNWLALNARAFAGHPEQGKWTGADLAHREAAPWFDPDGFILAERDGHLAGFHWTKIHKPAADQDDAGDGGTGGPVGEVYVVGVDPAEQGTGLGRALTLAGLRYLRDRGMPAVMLYADGENAAAIGLYGSLGFAHSATDVMYTHDPAGARLGHRLDAQNLVELLRRERTVSGGDGAEYLRIEFDLVERHAVVDSQIETLSHRAHLHRRADREPLPQGYDVARRSHMTQQGHSWITSG